MTRRKFVHMLVKAGSAFVVGVCWLAKKAGPRKFVRAIQLKKYPGALKAFPGFNKQSEWSG